MMYVIPNFIFHKFQLTFHSNPTQALAFLFLYLWEFFHFKTKLKKNLNIFPSIKHFKNIKHKPHIRIFFKKNPSVCLCFSSWNSIANQIENEKWLEKYKKFSTFFTYFQFYLFIFSVTLARWAKNYFFIKCHQVFVNVHVCISDFSLMMRTMMIWYESVLHFSSPCCWRWMFVHIQT